MGRPSTVVLCAVVALVAVAGPPPGTAASASVRGAPGASARLGPAILAATPGPPGDPAAPDAALVPSPDDVPTPGDVPLPDDVPAPGDEPAATPGPEGTPEEAEVGVAPPDAGAAPRPVEDLLLAALADVDRVRAGTSPDGVDVDAPPAMVAAAQDDREEFAAEGLAITESATTLVGAVVVTRTGDRQVVEAAVLTELVTSDGTGEDVLAHWSRTHRFTVEENDGALRLVADEVVEPAREPAVGDATVGSGATTRLVALLPALLVLLALTALVTGASLVLRRRAHPPA